MDTIIFDVDDTLYDQIVPFKIALHKLLKKSVSEQLLHAIYVSSRKHSDALFEKNLTGEISLLDMQTYRITEACHEVGIKISFQEAVDFQENYLEQQHKILLYKDIEILLDFLIRNNKQLALLTNGDKDHQSMKIKQLGLINWIPIEHHFISNAIGYAKPSEEVFLHIEKHLQLEKSKTVYIGDSFENDVVGAKQVGWNSIWMNHRKRAMPDVGFKPDLILRNPKELLDSFQK